MRRFCVLCAVATFAACDEGGIDCGATPLAPACVDGPTMSYADTSFVAAFFSTGSTPAPTIQWNGDTGTLSLAAPVTGVTVNPATGVVSWDESLPIGVSAVQVVAANSGGTDAAFLEIDNRFQGHFEGGYNNAPESDTITFDFEMTFGGDGTVAILDNGSSDGEGTWTRDGVTITSVYSYNGGSSFFTVEGDVAHDDTEAVLEGFWYGGDEAVSGSEAGYVAVTLVPGG